MKYISYDTSLLARDKGFNLTTPAFYKLFVNDVYQLFENKMINISDLNKPEFQDDVTILYAPFQEDLMVWLIHTHKIYVNIVPIKASRKIMWKGFIIDLKTLKTLNTISVGEDYYEVLERGLYLGLQEIRQPSIMYVPKFTCLHCGRNQFPKKMSHICNNGYRKSGFRWEEQLFDFKME